MTSPSAVRATEIRLIALPGIPMVREGDDLAALILKSVADCGERFQDGDILVIAQKVVSKAEGRTCHLDTVIPSPQAMTLAEKTGKDPRLLELILEEAAEVLRYSSGSHYRGASVGIRDGQCRN